MVTNSSQTLFRNTKSGIVDASSEQDAGCDVKKSTARGDYLDVFLKSFKMFCVYFFFVVEWKDSTKSFGASESRPKQMMFLTKAIMFGFYAAYELSNIPVDVFDRTKKMLNISMMFNITWTVTAFIILYFHVMIWRERHGFMSAMNAFAELYRQNDGVRWVMGLRAEIKLLLDISICHANAIMWTTVCGLIPMFLLDPLQPRYLYGLLRKEWQFPATLLGAVIVECYIIAHFLITISVIWGVILLYPVYMRSWLHALKKNKMEIDMNWKMRSSLIQKVRRQTRFRQTIGSYQEARILATWFNSCYETLFYIPFRVVMALMHSILLFAVLNFHDSLPLPTLAIFGFWSLSLFPAGGITLKSMADVATVSEQVTRNWGFKLTPLEERIVKSLRPFGIKSGKIVRAKDVLRGLLLVSILTKNFLLLC